MFDDAEIFRLRHQRIAVVVELQDLALGHLPAGFREGFVDALVAEVDDLADRARIEIVADENADLVAPDFARGTAASAQIGVIDDVVVQQGRGMDEFHQTAECLMILTGVSAEVSAEKHEEGADPFAAAIQNMRSDGINQGDAGVEILPDLILDPSSSSRYTSQTSAMLWSVRVVGPFDMGRIVGQETPTKSSTGRPVSGRIVSPFS